jgi:hypothetical protein
VSHYGCALEHISIELQSDREVVALAVENDWHSLAFTSEALKNDEQIKMIATTAREKHETQYTASDDITDDEKKQMIDTVTLDWRMLRHARSKLQNDRDVVSAALARHGYALQHASYALRNDKEMVLSAVSKNGYAMKFASIELREEKAFAMRTVTANYWSFRCVSKELRNDKEVAMVAVKNNKDLLEFASDALKNDPEIQAAAK